MGILFKSKKKIAKLQDGGSIPVYRTFQVKTAQQGQDNPALLLQRYAGSTTTTDKTDKPKYEAKDYKLDFLPTDIDAIGESIYTLTEELKKAYQYDDQASINKLESQLSHLQTVEIPKAEQNKKALEISEANIKDKGHGNDWMFENGLGWVKDREGNLMQVTGEEFRLSKDENGKLLYTPLSRYDAVDERKNNTSNLRLYSGNIPSMILNASFAQEPGRGVNLESSLKGIIENVYKGLGNNEVSTSNTVEGPTETGSITQAGSSSRSTNADRLYNAYSELSRILPGTEAWDALEAQAIKTVSDTEIQELGYDDAIRKGMDSILMDNMLKRVNLTEKETKEFREKVDKDSTGKAGSEMSISDVKDNLGEYVTQANSGGSESEPVLVTIGTNNPKYKKQGKEQEVLLDTHEAPKFDGDMFDKKLSLADNGDIKKVLRVNSSFSPQGANYNTDKWLINGEKYSFKDIAMPTDSTSSLKMATILVGIDGKMTTLQDQDGYEQMQKDIVMVKNQAQLSELYKDMSQEDIDSIVAEKLSNIAKEYNAKWGLKAQRVAIYEVIVPKEGAPANSVLFNDNGELQSNAAREPSPAETQRYLSYGAGEGEGTGHMYGVLNSKFKWNWGPDVTSDDLAVVTVFSPLQGHIDLQHASGKNVKIYKDYLLAENLKKNFFSKGEKLDDKAITDLVTYIIEE